MAHTGPLISKTPQGIEIKGRRRLNSDKEVEALIDEIQNMIFGLQERDENAVLVITDCDLSQNKLSPEHFENLFGLLGGANVRVQRFRLFGCPTINDEVLKNLGEYFKMLTAESVPNELHLSDCSITTDGFEVLMAAIEESESFPLVNPQTKRKMPLYLRLENNYIDEASIQEKVDKGLIRPLKKSTGSWTPRGASEHKVDLVVREDKKYQQKLGPPPPPEEAGPFKQVHDKTWGKQPWTGGNQWTGGKGAPQWPASQQQRPPSGQWQGQWRPQPPAGQWQPPAGQWRPPAGIRASMPAVVQPRFTAQMPPTAAVPQLRPGSARPGFTPQVLQTPSAWSGLVPSRPAQGIAARPFATMQQTVKGTGKGAPVTMLQRGAAAGDRSRTPVGRQAAQPVAPPPKSEQGLPHPWEEHWSDEYQIPYFWNTETGDSLWEKPTA
mmetsp:Transcript_68041/g.94302  ORF Transcript_68041/g.94302 Transcript_68041/m.94302 type:complete len:438 (+) Transcript_68041:3-1316(+)